MLFALPFFFLEDLAETPEPLSATAVIIIVVAMLIAAGTAVLLNRAAHAKKEVRAQATDEERRPETAAPTLTSALREKLQRLPVPSENREGAFQTISKIVEEETEERLKEVKQEYSVKYQVMMQEKNKEVEGIRREFNKAVEQYDEVKREYKKVEIEKKNTEAVVKSIAEGLVVVNQKGEVLLMNPAAEKLLGVQNEKKIGKPIVEGLGSEHLVSMSRQMDGSSGEKVVEYTSKDENVKKVIRSSSAVIQDENGQTVGMVNVLTDITKQKELDEIKTRFVSNVTHELRTPMVAMQKAIEILNDKSSGTLNTTQANFLGIVQRNLQMLSRLVEDLLDMAKIESGKMRLKFLPTRLDKIVNDACDSLVTWANSKDIQVIRDIDKSLPEISLDSVKITQVLNNLIGNAIKFTPRSGKIFVNSGWNDTESLKVSVADTGVGVAKENLPKLFGRFEQFGDLQGISGTGLGLCISKEIVERHNGRISVESEEKKGATFTFILPLKQQQSIGGGA